MNLNDFQSRSFKTAMYPNKGKNKVYPMLGAIGEFGELIENIKKIIRDDRSLITPERREAIKNELGDLMWYIAAICTEFEIELELCAIIANIDDLHKIELHEVPKIVFETHKHISDLVSDTQQEQISIDICGILSNLSKLANAFSLDLRSIASSNIDKLLDRLSRNVIKGDGDNR